MLAGLVLLGAIGASAFGGKDSQGAASTPGAVSAPTLALPAVSVESSTTAFVPVTPVATIAHTALTRTVTDGMTGDDVRRIQERLVELKFDPGPVDGIFGLQTIQSVWAFKKLVELADATTVDGSVTPELWETMQNPISVIPRRTELTSTHVEIYLDRQVMVLFTGNVPGLITHISSGSGEDWCSEVSIDPGEEGNETGTDPLKKGICGKSQTPGGQFSITRKLNKDGDPDGDGWREGKLGRMYKPVYWNYGLAIHGSSNVPKKPASHGCIRIPMHIAEYFPDRVSKGDAVYVWDGVKDPETYGRQKPYFDRPDPDYSTTTAVPTTTEADEPATTKAATASSTATTSTQAPNSSSSSTSSTSSSTTAAPATNPPATAVP